MRKRWLLQVFLLFTPILLSQSKADSLRFELGKAQTDTVKINILHELFDYYIEVLPKEAERVLAQATELTGKGQNPHLLIANYRRHGEMSIALSEYDAALLWYRNVLDESNKINFQRGICDALFGLGY
jgi:hypothetical protein